LRGIFSEPSRYLTGSAEKTIGIGDPTHLTGYTDGTTTGTYTYDTKQLRQIGESITYASTSTAQKLNGPGSN